MQNSLGVLLLSVSIALINKSSSLRLAARRIEYRHAKVQRRAGRICAHRNVYDAVVLALGCYPKRLQYWQRTEVTGLFTEAYMGMAPAFGFFGMGTSSSCRCPELSTCL